MTDEEIIDQYGEWPGRQSILGAMKKARLFERAILTGQLLQRFNDYETPLTMTAQEVREIIGNYQPNKPVE
jgi:hypothetical protein